MEHSPTIIKYLALLIVALLFEPGENFYAGVDQ